MVIEDFKTFMIKWNNRFPIDRWWRKKHNVAFLSPEHRECSFLSQMMEFQEDQIFRKMEKEIEEDENSQDKYVPNIGDWLKVELIEGEISIGEIEDFEKEAAELDRFSKNT